MKTLRIANNRVTKRTLFLPVKKTKAVSFYEIETFGSAHLVGCATTFTEERGERREPNAG
jgi:hypothetical protein